MNEVTWFANLGKKGISNLDFHIWGQGVERSSSWMGEVEEDWMATNPQITRFLEFFATTPPQKYVAAEIDQINWIKDNKGAQIQVEKGQQKINLGWIHQAMTKRKHFITW